MMFEMITAMSALYATALHYITQMPPRFSYAAIIDAVDAILPLPPSCIDASPFHHAARLRCQLR